MTTYINLPLTGASAYWGNAVDTSANLPSVGQVDGAVVFVTDTASLWYWDASGGVWTEFLNGPADVAGPASSTDEAVARFDGTTGKVIQNSAVTIDMSGNLVTAAKITAATAKVGTISGVVKAASGDLSAGPVDLASADVSGVVPVGNGGTNSATALNNNRVVVSAGGALVESAAITASRAVVTDSNGLPVAATTTATEIGYVNGVTSAIQTQLNTKVAGPASAVDSTVPRYDLTTGKLIKGSGVTIDASDNIATTARINSGTAKIGATGATTASVTLEVAGTSGAFLMPRMTAVQRDALTPAEGMMIFLTDTKRFQGYFDAAWTNLHGWGD